MDWEIGSDLGTRVREDGLNAFLEGSELLSSSLDVLLLFCGSGGQGGDDVIGVDLVSDVVGDNRADEGEIDD